MKIDNYQIGELIGRGGFGEVFRARRADLDREDAIKVLNADMCRDAMAVARFLAEAKAASRIDHAGVVRVYGFGTSEEGRAYCVMELLRGQTLRALLDEQGRLSLPTALPILSLIADAIDAAHTAGVAHRDLKPENIFIESDGSIRVIDFGLAKLTGEQDLSSTGHVMGSPKYMSPEQCRGNGADARSDLYSFGALAYHLLVGEPPFAGDTLALALAHLNETPVAPSVREPSLPQSVDAVILELLAKEPERRPRPLTNAVRALETGAPRVDKRRTPSRWVVCIVALGFIAAVVTGLYAVLRKETRRRPGVVIDAKPVLSLVESRFLGEVASAWLGANDGEISVYSGTSKYREDLSTGVRHPDEPQLLGTSSDGRRFHLAPAFPVNEPAARELTETAEGGTAHVIIRAVESGYMQNDQLAVFAEGWLQTFDAKTNIWKRVLSSKSPVLPWFSPNGQRVIYSPFAGTIHIVRISDGDLVELKLPLLAQMAVQSSAVFVDDTHIVYCAEESGLGTVRVRSIEPGPELGTVVHTLDSHVAHCDFSSRGDFVGLTATHGRREIGALNIAKGALRPLVPVQDLFPRDTLGERQVVTRGNEGPLMVAYPGRSELDTLTTCPGAMLVGTSDSSFWMKVEESGAERTITLQSDKCSDVASWKIGRGSLSAGVCRGDVCAIVLYEDDNRQVSTYLLRREHPAAFLGTVPVTPERDGGTTVGLAPDKRHVVVFVDGVPTGNPVVFQVNAKPLPIKLSGFPQSVVWGEDPSHFYVIGMLLEGSTYAALEVALDGSRKVIWKSESDWFDGKRTNGSGTEIYGGLMRMRSEFIIFKRGSHRLAD